MGGCTSAPKEVSPTIEFPSEHLSPSPNPGTVAVFGSYDSGKTTLVRKLRLLYGDPFLQPELEAQRRHIESTILFGIYDLVTAFLELYPPVSQSNNPLASPGRPQSPMGGDNTLRPLPFQQHPVIPEDGKLSTLSSFALDEDLPNSPSHPSVNPGDTDPTQEQPQEQQLLPHPTVSRAASLETGEIGPINTPALRSESPTRQPSHPDVSLAENNHHRMHGGGAESIPIAELSEENSSEFSPMNVNSSHAPGGRHHNAAAHLAVTTYPDPPPRFIEALQFFLMFDTQPMSRRANDAVTTAMGAEPSAVSVRRGRRPSAQLFPSKLPGGGLDLDGGAGSECGITGETIPVASHRLPVVSPFENFGHMEITPSLAEHIWVLWNDPIIRWIYQSSHTILRQSILPPDVRINNNNNVLVGLCEGYILRLLVQAQSSIFQLYPPTRLLARLHNIAYPSPTTSQHTHHNDFHSSTASMVSSVSDPSAETSAPQKSSYTSPPLSPSTQGAGAVLTTPSMITDLDVLLSKDPHMTRVGQQEYENVGFVRHAFDLSRLSALSRQQVALYHLHKTLIERTLTQTQDELSSAIVMPSASLGNSPQYNSLVADGPGLGDESIHSVTSSTTPIPSNNPSMHPTWSSSQQPNLASVSPSRVHMTPSYSAHISNPLTAALAASKLVSAHYCVPRDIACLSLFAMDNLEEPLPPAVRFPLSSSPLRAGTGNVNNNLHPGNPMPGFSPFSPSDAASASANGGLLGTTGTSSPIHHDLINPAASYLPVSLSVASFEAPINVTDANGLHSFDPVVYPGAPLSTGHSSNQSKRSTVLGNPVALLAAKDLANPPASSPTLSHRHTQAVSSTTNAIAAASVTIAMASAAPLTTTTTTTTTSQTVPTVDSQPIIDKPLIPATTQPAASVSHLMTDPVPDLATDIVFNPSVPSAHTQNILTVFDCGGSNRSQASWPLVMKQDVKLVFYVISLNELLNAPQSSSYGFLAQSTSSTNRSRAGSHADFVSRSQSHVEISVSGRTSGTTTALRNRMPGSPMVPKVNFGFPTHAQKVDIFQKHLRKNINLFSKTLRTLCWDSSINIVVVFSKYDLLAKHLLLQRAVYEQYLHEKSISQTVSGLQPHQQQQQPSDTASSTTPHILATPVKSSATAAATAAKMTSPKAANTAADPIVGPYPPHGSGAASQLILFNDIFPQFNGNCFDPHQVAQFLIAQYLQKLGAVEHQITIVVPRSGLLYLNWAQQTLNSAIHQGSVNLHPQTEVKVPTTQQKIFPQQPQQHQHTANIPPSAQQQLQQQQQQLQQQQQHSAALGANRTTSQTQLSTDHTSTTLQSNADVASQTGLRASMSFNAISTNGPTSRRKKTVFTFGMENEIGTTSQQHQDDQSTSGQPGPTSQTQRVVNPNEVVYSETDEQQQQQQPTTPHQTSHEVNTQPPNNDLNTVTAPQTGGALTTAPAATSTASDYIGQTHPQVFDAFSTMPHDIVQIIAPQDDMPELNKTAATGNADGVTAGPSSGLLFGRSVSTHNNHRQSLASLSNVDGGLKEPLSPDDIADVSAGPSRRGTMSRSGVVGATSIEDLFEPDGGLHAGDLASRPTITKVASPTTSVAVAAAAVAVSPSRPMSGVTTFSTDNTNPLIGGGNPAVLQDIDVLQGDNHNVIFEDGSQSHLFAQAIQLCDERESILLFLDPLSRLTKDNFAIQREHETATASTALARSQSHLSVDLQQ